MIQEGGNNSRRKDVQEKSDEQQEEDILNGITSVAEKQESNLTTIQSQPRTDGN